jgi:hypothetical protein
VTSANSSKLATEFEVRNARTNVCAEHNLSQSLDYDPMENFIYQNDAVGKTTAVVVTARTHCDFCLCVCRISKEMTDIVG